jgi:hypothetical protein
VPYIQQPILQVRRNIKERNQRKIIIGWAKGPSSNQRNFQVLEKYESGRQHWCIDPLRGKLKDVSD